MARPFCHAVRASWDAERIAEGLSLGVGDVKELFANIRVTTWLAAIWAGQVMPVPPGPNDVIRCFSRNPVRFQTSKRVGARRSCSMAELIRDARKVDRYVVIDARRFPELTFYPLIARVIVHEAVQGRLTMNGVAPAEFDGWVCRNFELRVVDTP